MMLNKNKDAKRLVEAILFAADEPLDIETIKSKIELNVDVLKILKELQSEFIERGINLYEISNKWSFRTAENLLRIINQLRVLKLKRLEGFHLALEL
jgi:segregation and condensation protein B